VRLTRRGRREASSRSRRVTRARRRGRRRVVTLARPGASKRRTPEIHPPLGVRALCSPPRSRLRAEPSRDGQSVAELLS
jgi:hypothetical protein